MFDRADIGKRRASMYLAHSFKMCLQYFIILWENIYITRFLLVLSINQIKVVILYDMFDQTSL